jgi:hypothetical protein
MSREESATEETLLADVVTLAKGNIFTRMFAPCYDAEEDSVDLMRLRKALGQFKDAPVEGESTIARSFSTLLRHIEHAVVVRLASAITSDPRFAEIDTASGEEVATTLEGINVHEPAQSVAPHIQVEVVHRPPKDAKGKITLTSFDTLKEQCTTKLQLRADTEGRLVNPNSDTVWEKSTGASGHFVCVGHRSATSKDVLPIQPEDVAFCVGNGFLYDKTRVKGYKKPIAPAGAPARAPDPPEEDESSGEDAP